MTDASDTAAGAPPAAAAPDEGRRRTAILVGALLALVGIGIVVVLLLASGGGSSSPGPADYHAEITAWIPLENHKPVEGYVESAWHDPAYSYVILAIDTRSSDETAPPLASAQLARIQTTQLVGFKERGMRWIKLGGRPAVRWSFNVADRAHIEYFFEECGISFLVRGTTGLPGFSAISEDMRAMAATIKAAC